MKIKVSSNGHGMVRQAHHDREKTVRPEPFDSPFALSLSFDFAQDVREEPIMVSLSNHRLTMIGTEELRTVSVVGPLKKFT